MLGGMALAVFILAMMVAGLLLAGGSSARALVLVWLWALPFLGVFGLAGWLVGKATARSRGGR